MFISVTFNCIIYPLTLFVHATCYDNLLLGFSCRFIRTLLNFYKPSSRQFYAIQYSEANAKKYSAAGLELIKFLNQKDQVFL